MKGAVPDGKAKQSFEVGMVPPVFGAQRLSLQKNLRKKLFIDEQWRARAMPKPWAWTRKNKTGGARQRRQTGAAAIT